MRLSNAQFLFADNFHNDAFFTPPVKLAVKNLLPRAEVELAVRDRHHYLAAHDLALQMRIRVVFAGAIVLI